MKNETNKQHTPGLWHVTQSVNIASDKGKIIAFTSDKIVNSKGGISAFNHEERKANAQLIARAPELLKENEQLKLQNEAYEEREINNFKKRDDLQALNAELLEALKKSNIELSELSNLYWLETESFSEGSDERRMYLNRLADVRNRMNENKSAIAKAEGKDLGG